MRRCTLPLCVVEHNSLWIDRSRGDVSCAVCMHETVDESSREQRVCRSSRAAFPIPADRSTMASVPSTVLSAALRAQSQRMNERRTPHRPNRPVQAHATTALTAQRYGLTVNVPITRSTPPPMRCCSHLRCTSPSHAAGSAREARTELPVAVLRCIVSSIRSPCCSKLPGVLGDA